MPVSWVVCCSLLVGWLLTACLSSSEPALKHRPASELPELLQPGRCKHLYRTDPWADLPGKCFAGTSHKEHANGEVRALTILNHRECRSLCCNLGDQCNTWQFQNSTGLCKVDKGMDHSSSQLCYAMLCHDSLFTHDDERRIRSPRQRERADGSLLRSLCARGMLMLMDAALSVMER
jgi:hypothetical protein